MSNPVAESKAIAEKQQTIEEEFRQEPIAKTNAGQHLPPAKYFEKDPRDEYYETKKLLTKAIGDEALVGFGNQLPVTDADIKYLIDQKTKQDLWTYDKWFYETFKPGSDPNKLRLYREMNPQWFQRRETEIKREIEIAKKLAKLGMRGPRTEEEIQIMYALDTGRIEAPDLDRLFPELMNKRNKDIIETNKRSVTQGYWNPRRYTIDKKVLNRSVYDDGHTLMPGEPRQELLGIPRRGTEEVLKDLLK